MLPSPEFSTQALNVLGARSGQDEFNDSNVATDMSSSLDSELINEESTAFPDIQYMKNRAPKGPNLFPTELTLDSDRELRRSKSKKQPGFQIMAGRKHSSVS